MDNVKDKTNNKTLMLIIGIVLTILIIGGGTLAYWSWETNESEKTAIQFKVTPDFSCSVDGGQNINQTEALIAPTTCTNSTYAIKREITVGTDVINRNTSANINVNMDLWIKVNSLGDGLKNSRNFRYALTTSDTSCEVGVVSNGNLNDLTTGDKKTILKRNYGADATETYYLWIWLDEAEDDPSTMDQAFSVELGGECTNTPGANHPVLDDGMIPVTISAVGNKTTTVSSMDDSWYDYDQQKWANVVLVKENGTNSRSYYKNNPGVEVVKEDILAYYVWIPRYKYRIPYKKCSEIPEAERTDINKYPECYAPYSMNTVDKDNLAEYLTCAGETKANSLAEINYALEKGKLLIGGESSILSAVQSYNSGANNCSNVPSNEDLSIGQSEFNGNNRLIGAGNEVLMDIEFEAANSLKSNGDAINTYYTHPAFTFGGDELSGIWVAKFEASHSDSELVNSSANDYLACKTIGCSAASGIIIKPEVRPVRRNSLEQYYFVSRSLVEVNTFGLNSTQTDSHLMKNSEWGAITYLSNSIYGIGSDGNTKEVRLNSYEQLKTGCGASSNSASSDVTCYNVLGYGRQTEYLQSTTRNSTGVFDLSGGVYEYVMTVSSSSSSSSAQAVIRDIPAKYYDLYTGTTFFDLCDGEICKGHALIETANWYNDLANGYTDWFVRGGNHEQTTSPGLFSFNGIDKFTARTYGGFRPILAVLR